jgi:maleamate amidohydrolase
MTTDLTSNYAGAFGGHLQPGTSPALLIVDVVMAYLDPASPLYAGGEAALASNERLLASARTAGIPVVFTNVIYAPGGIDGGLFYRKVPALQAFVRGSPMGLFPPSMQPLASEIIVSKQYASAFFGSSLASTLTAMGVNTLFITGFSTSGCVRATALDALQLRTDGRQRRLRRPPCRAARRQSVRSAGEICRGHRRGDRAGADRRAVAAARVSAPTSSQSPRPHRSRSSSRTA